MVPKYYGRTNSIIPAVFQLDWNFLNQEKAGKEFSIAPFDPVKPADLFRKIENTLKREINLSQEQFEIKWCNFKN